MNGSRLSHYASPEVPLRAGGGMDIDRLKTREGFVYAVNSSVTVDKTQIPRSVCA